MAPITLKNDALKRTEDPLGRIEPTRRLRHCGQQPARGEIMPALAIEQDQTAPTRACSTTAGIATLTDQLQAVAASLAHIDCDCSDAATWIALNAALASVHVALIMLGDVVLPDAEAPARTDRPTTPMGDPEHRDCFLSNNLRYGTNASPR